MVFEMSLGLIHVWKGQNDKTGEYVDIGEEPTTMKGLYLHNSNVSFTGLRVVCPDDFSIICMERTRSNVVDRLEVFLR